MIAGSLSQYATGDKGHSASCIVTIKDYLLSLIVCLVLRILLASLFLFAGMVHLTRPALFLPVMPPFIPFPFLCIIASGIFELLGGAGLLVPNRHVQLLTGWGLALLLIAVFPANIYMAVANVQLPGLPIAPWIEWCRLLLQPLLILGVLWVTSIWPRPRVA